LTTQLKTTVLIGYLC